MREARVFTFGRGHDVVQRLSVDVGVVRYMEFYQGEVRQQARQRKPRLKSPRSRKARAS